MRRENLQRGEGLAGADLQGQCFMMMTIGGVGGRIPQHLQG